jgi:hypothetical protein
MTFYIFHKPEKAAEPEYVCKKRSRKAAMKFIEVDVAMLKKAYPDVKWSKRAYFIARRVK